MKHPKSILVVGDQTKKHPRESHKNPIAFELPFIMNNSLAPHHFTITHQHASSTPPNKNEMDWGNHIHLYVNRQRNLYQCDLVYTSLDYNCQCVSRRVGTGIIRNYCSTSCA